MSDDKIRVLVVDDSATMRKLLMQILQQDSEIEVVGTAMNGIFALNKLESLKPDIITLDIEMPLMDGLQFLEEKNKKNDTTPVIILSSLHLVSQVSHVFFLHLCVLLDIYQML